MLIYAIRHCYYRPLLFPRGWLAGGENSIISFSFTIVSTTSASVVTRSRTGLQKQGPLGGRVLLLLELSKAARRTRLVSGTGRGEPTGPVCSTVGTQERLGERGREQVRHKWIKSQICPDPKSQLIIDTRSVSPMARDSSLLELIRFLKDFFRDSLLKKKNAMSW